MSTLVKDYNGVPILSGDLLSCEIPIEGFLTKDKNYLVYGLIPEDSRIVIEDDRQYPMWANANRFRVWLCSSELYIRLKTMGWSEEEIQAVEEKAFFEKTTCKDCGVETKPGTGSARCPQCWEDRCGNS